MNWEEIKFAVHWFVIGAAVGYFWHPLWAAGKKIVEEAKKAREEW